MFGLPLYNFGDDFGRFALRRRIAGIVSILKVLASWKFFSSATCAA